MPQHHQACLLAGNIANRRFHFFTHTAQTRGASGFLFNDRIVTTDRRSPLGNHYDRELVAACFTLLDLLVYLSDVIGMLRDQNRIR